MLGLAQPCEMVKALLNIVTDFFMKKYFLKDMYVKFEHIKDFLEHKILVVVRCKLIAIISEINL